MRRLLAPLLALALVAAACGGGDDKKDAAKESPSADATTTTAADTTTSTTATTAPAGPNASGTGQGATAPAGSGQQGATATTSKSSPATAKNAVKHAAAGAYTYNRTGTARTSAFGDRSLNGQLTLRVDPPNGQDQRAVQESQDGSSEQIVRILDEGAYFTYLKQSSSGLSKEFRPDPIVLAVPHNPAVGRSWSWTIKSTDGATTLNATIKVERTETLTIGGEQVPTTVLSVVLKTSGDVELNSNQTTWLSLSKGLTVRTDEKSDGRFGNVTFNSDSTQTLVSTKPS